MVTSQHKGKRAEFLVFGELTRNGAEVYLPVIDTGIDAVVRRKDGTYLEIQVKSTEASEQAGWFNVYDLHIHARDAFFIVCVDLSKEPPETWVIPSEVFMDHSIVWDSGKGWSRYTLGIDSRERKHGNQLRRDLLQEFCGAWELLTK